MKQVEYGLVIERRARHETQYVQARLVRRENRAEHPLGCSHIDIYESPAPHAGREYDGLGMYGFISDGGDNPDYAYIGHFPEYRDVFAIDIRVAKRMVKTLTLVCRAIEKADAREPSYQFEAMARALRLSFVVERRGDQVGMGYSESSWRWLTVVEGRNRFRQLIEEARADVRQSKAA